MILARSSPGSDQSKNFLPVYGVDPDHTRTVPAQALGHPLYGTRAPRKDSTRQINVVDTISMWGFQLQLSSQDVCSYDSSPSPPLPSGHSFVV
jgi:hypothetical protein